MGPVQNPIVGSAPDDFQQEGAAARGLEVFFYGWWIPLSVPELQGVRLKATCLRQQLEGVLDGLRVSTKAVSHRQSTQDGAQRTDSDIGDGQATVTTTG